MVDVVDVVDVVTEVGELWLWTVDCGGPALACAALRFGSKRACGSHDSSSLQRAGPLPSAKAGESLQSLPWESFHQDYMYM